MEWPILKAAFCEANTSSPIRVKEFPINWRERSISAAPQDQTADSKGSHDVGNRPQRAAPMMDAFGYLPLSRSQPGGAARSNARATFGSMADGSPIRPRAVNAGQHVAAPDGLRLSGFNAAARPHQRLAVRLVRRRSLGAPRGDRTMRQRSHVPDPAPAMRFGRDSDVGVLTDGRAARRARPSLRGAVAQLDAALGNMSPQDW